MQSNITTADFNDSYNNESPLFEQAVCALLKSTPDFFLLDFLKIKPNWGRGRDERGFKAPQMKSTKPPCLGTILEIQENWNELSSRFLS